METPRMLDLDPHQNSGGGDANEPGENLPSHEIEDAANARFYNSHESAKDSFISTAETPQELIEGGRDALADVENAFVLGDLTDRYTPPREVAVMLGRAKDLSKSIEVLENKGYIVKGSYNPVDGTARPRRQKHVPFSIYVDEKPIYVEVGGRLKHVDNEQVYYYGTNEERAEMAKEYQRMAIEFAARHIVGEHYGLDVDEEIRDALELISRIKHGGRMPKFKAVHLEALFNMPDADLALDNPENRKLGDKVERSMFLTLLMLNSGSKAQMQDFLKRPGAERIILEISEEMAMTKDQWIKEYVGLVEDWEGDNVRLITDKGGAKATWRVEVKDGRRKALTKWGNIVAWGGKPGEFGEDKEIEFIEKTIGGLVESKEAAWVAVTFLRGMGMFASEGYVALANGKSHLPLGEGRIFSGNDFGKCYPLMLAVKEGFKKRKSGLRGMLGKIPDMSINLFDWGQVVVGYDEEGEEIRRSIMDAWLGTAEQPMRVLLTGKIARFGIEELNPAENENDIKDKLVVKTEVPATQGASKREIYVSSEDAQKIKEGKLVTVVAYNPNSGKSVAYYVTPEEKSAIEKGNAILMGDTPFYAKKVKREESIRLGDLKFSSLDKFHGSYAIMQWLIGNGEKPTGVLIEALRTSFRYEDFELENLKAIWKYVSIIMNPVILTKGSTHLYSDTYTAPEIIQLNYFRNLMVARIHSASFSTGVLNSEAEMFNPNRANVKVPVAIWIKAAIAKILEDAPETLEQLREFYLDENEMLRKMGEGGNAGTSIDKSALLEELFLPKTDRAKRMAGYVGKVTGLAH